jgi:hypothetical protein
MKGSDYVLDSKRNYLHQTDCEPAKRFLEPAQSFTRGIAA